MKPQGIHHVTAIAGPPQRNLDFYAGVLGLRFIKRTVNFDDPSTYHLYYGDEVGNPGTVLTFFPWGNNGAPAGRPGTGQLTTTAFSIPRESLGYWTERLVEHGVRFEKPVERFGDSMLHFADPDGIGLELVAEAEDTRPGWQTGPVPEEHAVRGFESVALSEKEPGRTAELLTGVLGFRRAGEEDGRFRYEAGEGGSGNRVHLLHQPEGPTGRMGIGAVHHVAFRVPDHESHEEIREEIAKLGYSVTPVIDRQYFDAIYFREPGGVLFEIATDPPGFTTDETVGELGTNLKLPPQYEEHRADLERTLPELSLPVVGGGK